MIRFPKEITEALTDVISENFIGCFNIKQIHEQMKRVLISEIEFMFNGQITGNDVHVSVYSTGISETEIDVLIIEEKYNNYIRLNGGVDEVVNSYRRRCNEF